MTNVAEKTLTEKIALYLEAKGYSAGELTHCGEGMCWKDSNGKFTIKSRLPYTHDGRALVKSFYAVKNADGTTRTVTEEEAMTGLYNQFLKNLGYFTCNRCGGRGGWKGWPGYTCFECGGSGIDHEFQPEKTLAKHIKGEDFTGDYIARKQAEGKEAEVESERRAQDIRQRALERIEEWKKSAEVLHQPAVDALQFLGISATGEWAEQLLRFIQAYTGLGNGWEGSLPDLKRIEEVIQGVALRQTDNHRQAAISKHVGTVGERSDFVARVTFYKSWESDFGTRHITKLADDNGNVLVYWNTINIPDENIEGTKRPAKLNERVTFSAGIKEHGEYQNIPQTTLTRATKAKLA